MQRLRYGAGWTCWTPALALAVGGIALLPCRTQAQAQAKENKPAQKEEPPKTAPDKRTLQLSGYTLKLVDNDRNAGFQGGGQFGGKVFRPNVTFYLDISAEKPDAMLLLRGVENLHGTDDKGRIVRGPEGAFGPSMMPRFGVDGVNRQTLSLQTEEGAASLKTLEGNLVLETGSVQTITFIGEDLHPDAEKKVNQITVTLDFFKQYKDNEVRIYLTCLYPHFNQPADPLAPRRPTFWNNQRVTVDVIGTDGVTYKNESRSESSRPERSQGLVIGGPNNLPLVTMMVSHINLGYQQIPDGVHVKSIICHVIDQQADARSIPFKFTDIPLSGKP